MYKNADSLLAKIWDSIQMIDVKASAEEIKTTSRLEVKEMALLSILNEEQKAAFYSYESIKSEINYMSECDAFIKGVKFATRYILEIEDD